MISIEGIAGLAIGAVERRLGRMVVHIACHSNLGGGFGGLRPSRGRKKDRLDDLSPR
jgi:hypothetical protein